MAFVFLRRALAGKWRLGMLGVVGLLTGCAGGEPRIGDSYTCLLYTSDAADE